MRNGVSLHPMCLPGGQGILHPSQLSHMEIDFDDASGSYDMNMTTELNTIPVTSNTTLNLPNQCTSSVKPSLATVPSPSIINSEAMSFGLESCMPGSFHPYQPRNPPRAVGRERSMPHEKKGVNYIETKSLSAVTTSTRLGHNSVQERMQQKHAPQETHLENISGQNLLVSSNFSGYKAKVFGFEVQGEFPRHAHTPIYCCPLTFTPHFTLPFTTQTSSRTTTITHQFHPPNNSPAPAITAAATNLQP